MPDPKPPILTRVRDSDAALWLWRTLVIAGFISIAVTGERIVERLDTVAAILAIQHGGK